MLKAYKFRIYPNEQQKILINKTFGCSRFIYNRILADAIQNYKETGKSKLIDPAKYKKEFEWLKEVDSLALCNAYLHVQIAYQKFFKKQNKFPKFHKKGVKDSYTTNLINGNIKIKNNKIKLPKLGLMNCVFHRFVKGIIKSVAVTKTKSEKYFISILTEQKPKIKEVNFDRNNRVGIDMSMEHLAVLSDGTKAKYPRFYREYEQKLKFLQRKLSRKTVGSQNYKKLKLRIARLHEKIVNCRKDFQHKLSRQIVNQYDVIVVEDINFKGLSQCLNLGKSIHDIGFGSFRAMLEYKTKWAMKDLIKADKWFPSSKTCSVCGFVNKDLKLSDREWQCSNCGTHHDRDINAAINLRNYSTDAMSGSNAYREDLVLQFEKASFGEAGKVGVIGTAYAAA